MAMTITEVAMTTSRTFKAMGTTAHVLITNGDDGERLVDRAVARIEDLENRWSRFRPTSELCRLNATPGRPVLVSQETFEVVSRAVDAWFLTEGRYDPTILPALIDAGYDRSFEQLPVHSTNGTNVTNAGPIDLPAYQPRLAPGCAEIRLGHTVDTVTLPVGVELDLGGIGKGYAADLVANELVKAGAGGACVSIGGDTRCIGTAPRDEGWVIEVDDPAFPSEHRTLLRLTLAEGAVVTTSRTRRRWTRNGITAHHIIDPSTGRPAETGLAAVTVLAGEAWWAEVFAKAAFLAGPVHGLEVLAKADVSGFLVDDAGVVHRANRLESFEPVVPT
jgi:thiamine biosynthesis lipoprotein